MSVSWSCTRSSDILSAHDRMMYPSFCNVVTCVSLTLSLTVRLGPHVKRDHGKRRVARVLSPGACPRHSGELWHGANHIRRTSVLTLVAVGASTLGKLSARRQQRPPCPTPSAL